MSTVQETIEALKRGHPGLEPAGMLEAIHALDGTMPDTDLARVYNHFGVRAFEQAVYDVAIELYNEARALYEANDDRRGLATVLNNLGNAHKRIADTERMHTLFEQSLEISRSNGYSDLEAETLSNIAVAIDAAGDLKGALARYEEVLGIAKRINHRDLEGTALLNIAAVLADLGDAQRSMSYAYRALDVAIEVNDQRDIVLIKISLAMSFIKQSDLPMAMQLAEEALAVAKNVNDQGLISNALTTLAEVHELLGNGETATDLITQVLESAQRRNDIEREGYCCRGLGLLHMKDGNTAEAIRYYRRSVECLEQAGVVAECLASKRLLVGALAHGGFLDEARAQHATYRSDQCYRPTDRISEEFVLAALAQAEGDLDTAVEHFERARTYAVEQSHKMHELAVARSLLDIAKERQDFAAFVEQTETITRLTEEIRGAEIKSRIAVREVQRTIEAERQERARERAVLYSTLPKEVADRMIRGEQVTGDHFNDAAILFADIVGFTSHAAAMSAEDVPTFLERLYRRFDEICAQHGVTKIKTIGDSYLCFKGDATAAVNALAVSQVARAMQRTEVFWPYTDPQERLQLRIGAHAGPVTAGVIGTERLQYDVWGDTVNVASRMESTGEPGRIHVSEAFANALDPGLRRGDDELDPGLRRGDEENGGHNGDALTAHRPPLTVKDSLTSDSLTFLKRGEISIKGKGPMTTYWLEEVVERT